MTRLCIVFLCVLVVIGMMMERDWRQPKSAQAASPAPEPVHERQSNDQIKRWSDDRYQVTCWTFVSGGAGGISCIPDQDLRAKL